MYIVSKICKWQQDKIIIFAKLLCLTRRCTKALISWFFNCVRPAVNLFVTLIKFIKGREAAALHYYVKSSAG